MARRGGLGFREVEKEILTLLHNKKTRTLLPQIHAKLIRHHLHHLNSVLSHFVSVCASLHRLPYAERVFLQATSHPDLYLFNSMIKGYSLSGLFQESLSLFAQMKRRGVFGDQYTFAPLLKACSSPGGLRFGCCVHREVVVNGFEWVKGVRVGVVELYSSNGAMEDAMKVFDEMSVRDVIFWNLMVRGYFKEGQVGVALGLFRAMPDRSVVSWNIVIAGLGECGRDSEALGLFEEMQDEGLKPDEATLVTLLPICARLGAAGIGEKIRSYAESSGLWKQFVSVGNALVNFYGKCGMVDTAMIVFNQMPKKNVVSWNTMISCFALHGKDKHGIEMFEWMIKEGFTPNEVTFVGVLTCCSHSGLLDRGRELFNLMTTSYQIEPKIEHYGCMVDLLGRGGHLKEAYDLIRSLPERPNAILWGSLLSASRTHGDSEIAQLSLKELIDLEPWNSGNYVLLSNIYAEEEKWDEVEMVRLMMREKQIDKLPGHSSVG